MVVLTSAVAEQFLNRADVRTALQQVRCEAVSQRVRADALGDSGRLGGFGHDTVELLG